MKTLEQKEKEVRFLLEYYLGIKDLISITDEIRAQRRPEMQIFEMRLRDLSHKFLDLEIPKGS